MTSELATIYLMDLSLSQGPGMDGIQSRAECIHRLKPHVSLAAAAEAVQEIDRLGDQTHATCKA